MCSLLQISSEWSHLNPIRSGAARNTTPVKFSELNGPRVRRVICIFLEIWLHNNYKWVRRLLDLALVFFFHWYFVPLVGHSFPQWFSRVSLVFLVFDEPRYIAHIQSAPALPAVVYFFKSLYLFAYVENAKCWPILAFLSWIHTLFSCTYKSMRWCTKADKYGVWKDNSWMEQPEIDYPDDPDDLITMIPRY